MDNASSFVDRAVLPEKDVTWGTWCIIVDFDYAYNVNMPGAFKVIEFVNFLGPVLNMAAKFSLVVGRFGFGPVVGLAQSKPVSEPAAPMKIKFCEFRRLSVTRL